jgi:putative ABC transport system permease protein
MTRIEEELTPPRVAEWLVRRVLPTGTVGESILGDLRQEYGDVVRAGTEKASRRWYWRQAFFLSSRYLWKRLGLGRVERTAPSGTKRFISDAVKNDLRYALRSAARSPGFTTVVVLCLALGIGANTVMFSIVNSVLLRPLPYQDPGPLTVVWETYRTRNMLHGGVSYPNLAEWRARNQVFEEIGGFRPAAHSLGGIDVPERVRGGRVTAGFFQVLKVSAAIGRTFLPEDDDVGAENVVVLSDGLWRRHFGGDPTAVGRTLQLDGIDHTVVGVLPPGFDFPVRVGNSEVWTPAALDVPGQYERAWPMLAAIGRLRPGVTLEGAQAAMDAIGRQLEVEYPETNTEHGFNLVSLHRQVTGSVAPLLMLLLGAVGFVLLIACANVANMTLARGGVRKTELAVRAALGAARGRLVQQLLTESLVLSLMGGVFGSLLAVGGVRVLVGIMPPDSPRVQEIGVDPWVWAFALAISVLTGVIFGTLPAVLSSRSISVTSLKEGTRGSRGVGHRRFRHGLLVAEVALALVLSVGAGLLIRSFRQMVNVDPGFEPAGVLTFNVAARWQDYPMDQRAAFYRDVTERLEGFPGVERAAAGTAMPLSGGFRASFTIEGQPEPERGTSPVTRYLSVTPGYFETLGISLRSGRVFTESDRRDAPGVVLVNEAAARAFWPDEDPIGQRIRPDVDITDADPDVLEVVGIVGDVTDLTLDAEAGPCIYVPYQQQTWPYMSFALRATVDPVSLVDAVRREIGPMTREPLFAIHALDRNLDRSVVARRFPMAVLAVYATMALVLAAAGIYGVLSYSVAQRRFELGVRMVLGAQREGLVGMVLKQAMGLVTLGVGIGLIATLAVTRLMQSMLFGVTHTDPITIGGVVLLLSVVALAACYGPTRRAASVDPVESLRSE